MILISERKFLGSTVFSGFSGCWLDADDYDEQTIQLYAQMMGWA